MHFAMKRFSPDKDPTGLWMSEKLNGVFARWDGRAFFTKSGRHIATPASFRDGLPNRPLLGELYMGPGTLEKVAAAVRRSVFWPHEWQEMRFCVFDAPDRYGATFGRRVELMRQMRHERLPEHLVIVPQTRVRDRSQVQDIFQWTVENGGEGLVLRNEAGDQSWKWKPFQDDEATVVEHVAGLGRLAGMVGALVVRWKGQLFSLGAGLCDEVRKYPPAIGAKVTFGYSGLSSAGIPLGAVFLCVRDYE